MSAFGFTTNRMKVAGLVVLTLCATACRRSSVISDPGPLVPVVYTDNYPLAYCAERLGGEAFHVQFPVPADVDPAYWRPDEATLRRYQAADLVLLNGADYAKWTHSVSLTRSRVRDTSHAFHDELLTIGDATVHKHGPQGEHSHEGLASHTWLDPRLLRRQAKAVADALSSLGAGADIEQAWNELDRELQQFESELERLARQPGRLMLASHPVYDYLTHFCEWQTKSLHWEPDETPSDKEWTAFLKLYEVHPASIMLWEGEPTAETRRKLEEIGVQCVVYELAANRPAQGDLLTVLNANLDRLRAALQPETPPAATQP